MQIKIFIGVVLSLMVTTLNAMVQAAPQDFRDGGVENTCIQVSEFVDNRWVNLSEKQLKDTLIFRLSIYNERVMVFGTIKMRYIKTISGKKTIDRYTGVLNNGKLVSASGLTSNRNIIYINIEDQHLKKMLCVSPE